MNTKLSHLPERFAFKLDEIGKRWIRETFGTDDYDKEDGYLPYFNYPNYLTKEGFLYKHHLDVRVHKDYTLIETSQLFPQPQIPTIEKGVMMLVWSEDEDLSVEREVVFFDGNYYYTKHPIKTQPLVCWRHAKPIPQIPEYTIEQLKEIVGHEFKIKQ